MTRIKKKNTLWFEQHSQISSVVSFSNTSCSMFLSLNLVGKSLWPAFAKALRLRWRGWILREDSWDRKSSAWIAEQWSNHGANAGDTIQIIPLTSAMIHGNWIALPCQPSHKVQLHAAWWQEEGGPTLGDVNISMVDGQAERARALDSAEVQQTSQVGKLHCKIYKQRFQSISKGSQWFLDMANIMKTNWNFDVDFLWTNCWKP